MISDVADERGMAPADKDDRADQISVCSDIARASSTSMPR
jgi:hypothetical protein